MAEPQKITAANVNSKEKNMSLDFEIGDDFLSSWKPMSAAKEDAMDFDLAPVSKGKNKSFDFEKGDMDFNLDDDFVKMSSFNIDMSDLDIYPPLKKDGTSKEKSKELPSGNDKGKMPSFDMDMPDLDISPPLKKDGTSKDKSKEFSSGNDKGKSDRFTFAFDFDDLDNFGFDPSSTKEASKAPKQNDSIESSPNGSGNPEMEGTSLMDIVGNARTTEDVPHKQSLPGTMITADMDCQDGGSKDLETSTKNEPSKLVMDDSIASKFSIADHEVSSDKAKTSSETTIDYAELPKNSHSEKSISVEPVNVEACPGKDAGDNLSSNSVFDNELSGGNLLGTPEKVYATVSIGEQNVNYSHTVAISENNNGETSECGIENHLIDNKDRKKSCTDPFSELSTGRENQEPASELLTLSSASLRPDKLSSKETEELASDKLADKETEIEKEPSGTCSRTSIQMEKAKSDIQKAPCNQKKSFAQPILDECRRDWNSIQSNRKLASLPMQHSKTLLGREDPQTQSKESSKVPKTSGEVPDASGRQSGKKLNDSLTMQNLDVLRGKSALGQRATNVKDLDTPRSSATLSSLSMEINKKAAQRSKIPVTLPSLPSNRSTPVEERSKIPATLPSLPSTKSTPVEENKLSACEGSRKPVDFHGPKLSSLNLDSVKSPSRKDIKSVGDITQNRVSLRKSPVNIANFADSQKLTPFTQSLKRKTSEEHDTDKTVLYPSKRCSQSPLGSRNLVDSSERVSEKKVSNQNKVEDDRNKSTLGNRQLYTFDVQHKENVKGLEILSLNENESYIKQAEAYSKELDDICNMLRKKNEEAKELLVRATVNSNTLLMLNHPLLQQKIKHSCNSEFFRYVNSEQCSCITSPARAVVCHIKKHQTKTAKMEYKVLMQRISL